MTSEEVMREEEEEQQADSTGDVLFDKQHWLEYILHIYRQKGKVELDHSMRQVNTPSDH
jgi:hypothetical protein